MRSILIATLVLMLAGTASAASVSVNQGAGRMQTVALNANDIKSMTVAQAAAIVGGAIVGGTIVDRIVDGTAFAILGVVAGAVLGNEWYERGMWPF